MEKVREEAEVELTYYPVMSTVQTSLQEYLHTSYRPDRDYVDGEVQERNLGEFDHAAMQAFLAAWFFQHRNELQIHVLTEIRIRISNDRVRIADVCLVARDQLAEQVLTRPPLAVIEILSPEDRMIRYNERLGDYRRMGVRHIWVIDPAHRIAYDCSTEAWSPVAELTVTGMQNSLPLSDLWNELQAQD